MRIDTLNDPADGDVEVGCLDSSDDEIVSLLDLDCDSDPDTVVEVGFLDADSVKSRI